MNYIAFIGTSRIINDHILASKKIILIQSQYAAREKK